MSRLTKNILYNLAGQGLLVILGFVAVRFVFRQLGADALGVIYFAVTLNAVLTPALDMGMGSTTVREVAAHATGEPGYIRDFLRTASSIYWGGYLLIAAGVYGLTPWLAHRWIHVQTLDLPTAVHALRVLAMGALLSLPRSFYQSAIRGKERMEFNNLIDVVTSGLQQAGTIVILVRGGGLGAVTYWLTACFALSILAYLSVSARFFSLRALLPGFSWPVVRRNLAFSARTAQISILSATHTQADKAIVSKLLPLGLFGYYTFASSAIARGALIASAVSQAAFPSFSGLLRAADRPKLLAQYRKLQDLLCFSTVPLFAAASFGAIPLFTYLFNAEAARIMLLPFILLCLGFYMNGALSTPYVLSLAMGKPEIAARSNFYALFTVLPATFVFVHFFGLSGAGFSWVFYHLFVYAYAVPRICTECLGCSPWDWYWHVLRVLAQAGLTYGVGWAIVVLEGGYSTHLLILAYLGSSAGFLLTAYFSIGPELKGSLEQFSPFRPRKAGVLPLQERGGTNI